MPNKLTRDKFIEKARMVHGDKYDYSKVEYVNAKTNIDIICPIHGLFRQQPTNHLSGQGCPLCGKEVTKKKLSLDGRVAINDIYDIYGSPCHKHWEAMMTRCYNINQKSCKTFYKDCTVCVEWHKLSNFKKWFDDPKNGYKDGYHLDKDILAKGNKVYSPETCCFVPPRINYLFIKCNKSRGDLPIGISKNGNKYQTATATAKGSHSYLGLFATPELAFNAYKEAKESYIKEIANKWKDKIAPNVYEAMMKYKVEITD